jgi:hypothetical protein
MSFLQWMRKDRHLAENSSAVWRSLRGADAQDKKSCRWALVIAWRLVRWVDSYTPGINPLAARMQIDE